MIPRTSTRSKLLIALFAAAAALIPAGSAVPTAEASPLPCTIDPDRELWIRDLSVVNDPVRTTYVAAPTTRAQGVWSFGRLIENLAPGLDPTEVVLHLFDEIEQEQQVNGFTIPGRVGPREILLDPWIARSPNFEKYGLDFTTAPFRLMGFVNRLDLRSGGGYSDTSGGEGRIVFCGIDPESGDAKLFTIIFEYELLADGCDDLHSWAEAWHSLGSIPFGPTYNKALQGITDKFSRPGVAPGRPNGSALLQLRTNELLAEFPWQWREFHLSGDSGMLELGTVAQTPSTSLVVAPLLADFINENEAAILAGEHEVPLTYQGQPFRGGSSDGDDLSVTWNPPGVLNNEARHGLALLTCNGCHTLETGTGFFQALPRQHDQTTFLSGFLTGISVIDPVDPNKKRSFNDLKRRATDLCGLLGSSCFDLSNEKPLKRPH